MPFSSTASITSTDLDNMLRGLHRNNADQALTGTTTETDLASTSITANTIGATGGFLVVAAGTITNSGGGQKDVRLKLGSTTVALLSRTAANAQDWMILAFCFQTSATAQRWFVLRSTDDSTAMLFDYTTSTEDSGTNLTLKITGDLANSADTITQKMFDVMVVQIS